MLPVAFALLDFASFGSHPDFCALLHSAWLAWEWTYLGLDVVQVLLARVEVVLVLAAVEAAVAKGVTKSKALTTSE